MTTNDGGYIRDHYHVPAYVGGRITFTDPCSPADGTIVGFDGHHLLVRFDGESEGDTEPAVLHPTWEVHYQAAARLRAILDQPYGDVPDDPDKLAALLIAAGPEGADRTTLYSLLQARVGRHRVNAIWYAGCDREQELLVREDQ
jgi:hypothetical protein